MVIKSRRVRWVEYVARMGEMKNAYKILIGKPDGKRPLGRPGPRSQDNIKMAEVKNMCNYTSTLLIRPLGVVHNCTRCTSSNRGV